MSIIFNLFVDLLPKKKINENGKKMFEAKGSFKNNVIVLWLVGFGKLLIAFAFLTNKKKEKQHKMSPTKYHHKFRGRN